MFQQKEIIHNSDRNRKCRSKITKCPGKVLKIIELCQGATTTTERRLK